MTRWTGPTRGCNWSTSSTATFRDDRGLAHRAGGARKAQRLTTDDQVAWAGSQPAGEHPEAYFRGECIRRFPGSVATASWDSVIFDLPGASHSCWYPRWTFRGPRSTSVRCWRNPPAPPTLFARSRSDPATRLFAQHLRGGAYLRRRSAMAGQEKVRKGVHHGP